MPRSRFVVPTPLSGAATLCVLGTVIVMLDQVARCAVMLFPWAWFPDPAGLILCAVLQLLVYGSFVAECKGGVTHVVGADRLVSLADLGEIERARLSRVRAVCGRIEEAQRLLAPAFDGTLVLMTLREEEWRLAARMRAMAPLAAEVDRLKAEAATDRGRQALRPQAEAVAAARKTDETVIKRIEQYARRPPQQPTTQNARLGNPSRASR